MHPKISIVIPVFNRLSLLRETLASVACQTEIHWECLLVDDGSEQDTIRFIHDFCLTDSRFSLIQAGESKKGGSVCRNRGWEAASAEYIMFLDSDDIMPKTCLSSRLAQMEQHPGYDYWVFDTLHFFNTPGDSPFRWNQLEKKTDDLARFLGHDNPWHTSGPVWTKKALEIIGGYDERAVCWQDWEFHTRALLSQCTYIKCGDDKAAVLYRKDLTSTLPSITADSNQNTGAQWAVLQTIVSILNPQNITPLQKNALAVTLYRLYEDALGRKEIETANQIIRNPVFLWLFSVSERWVLYLLLSLRTTSGAGKWVQRKLRRLLQKMNPVLFLSKESHTYIYYLLLFFSNKPAK